MTDNLAPAAAALRAYNTLSDTQRRAVLDLRDNPKALRRYTIPTREALARREIHTPLERGSWELTPLGVEVAEIAHARALITKIQDRIDAGHPLHTAIGDKLAELHTRAGL